MTTEEITVTNSDEWVMKITKNSLRMLRKCVAYASLSAHDSPHAHHYKLSLADVDEARQLGDDLKATATILGWD